MGMGAIGSDGGPPFMKCYAAPFIMDYTVFFQAPAPFLVLHSEGREIPSIVFHGCILEEDLGWRVWLSMNEDIAEDLQYSQSFT